MNVRHAHITAIGQDASDDALRIEVSALIDNELDDASADRVVDALLASDQLAEFWTNAHRAGDWMRSEEVVDVGDGGAFLRRFSSRLAAEPAIIAAKRTERSRARRFWVRTGLPGASIAAAFVAVAWVAMPSATGEKKVVATVAIVPADKADAGVVQQAGYTTTVDAERLNDYLAAHRDVTPFAYRGTAAPHAAAYNVNDPAPAADGRATP